jgi:adenylate cyclase
LILKNAPLLHQIRARVDKTLINGIQLIMSTEESKKMLRRHLNTKTNLVTMIVDINDSTVCIYHKIDLPLSL